MSQLLLCNDFVNFKLYCSRDVQFKAELSFSLQDIIAELSALRPIFIMSTLMSGDMNLTRPSTRVRVAPGGACTFSFGDPSTTTVKATPPPVANPVVSAPVQEGKSTP